MACYLNEAKGARTIRLTNGSAVLVDAGAKAIVQSSDVARLTPGIVRVSDEGEMPDVPADLVEAFHPLDHDHDGKPGGSTSAVTDIKALRAEYQAKMGKRPFPAWDADELKRRMGDA